MLKYSTQAIDGADREAIDGVLRGEWLTTGPYVGQFENALCEFTGAPYAVAVNSGTAALHAAVDAAGLAQGDEVIVPAISFVASSNCVLYKSGTPVFADVEADTLNIDPADVERKLGPRTRAIVAVDFAGHPCDHDALQELAAGRGIPVIEDAAHSLGASYRGQQVGTLQTLTTLSFHPVKHITTGEGGAVLTAAPELAKRVRSFRHHGIDLDLHARAKMSTWEYDVVTLGYNFRLPDINCALGLSQLKKLPRWLKRRNDIVKIYAERLAHQEMLRLPTERPDCSSAWHLYVVRLNEASVRVTRSQLFAAFRAENIGVNVHYIPIPWMSLYRNLGYQPGQWPIAEREYQRILSLPLYPGMTEADVDDVVRAVEKIWKSYRR
jgi:UDP-4-amino-4,6-dideoxy-N-acetyl-beta-L-altrosamine transaminase